MADCAIEAAARAMAVAADDPYEDNQKFWIAYAEAALTAAAPFMLPQWRGMESAPKDGREVLLRVKLRAGATGKQLVGHYMQGGHCIEDHPPIDRGWYFWSGCQFDKASEPIAWMPLPPPEEPR